MAIDAVLLTGNEILWRALLRMILTFCFALAATAAQPAPHEKDREHSLALVSRLRLLVKHGDLADKAFLEKTMGGKLVLRREAQTDRPDAFWERWYQFDLPGLEFPVRPYHGSSIPTGTYDYFVREEKTVKVDLSLSLESEDKNSCVTQIDMSSGFGSELPHNPFNATKPRVKFRWYLFNGERKIETMIIFKDDSGCVGNIRIRQE